MRWEGAKSPATMRAVGVGSDGSATVELVVIAPVIFVFAITLIALGRYEIAREQVIAGARAAAEAASVSVSPLEAQRAAVASATDLLLPHACPSMSVHVSTEKFFPGGDVAVTVVCQVNFSDLVFPGLPGSTVVQAVETAPIDPYRSVT